MSRLRRPAGGDAASLRARAEEKLRSAMETGAPHSEADSLRLLHELQVHQIELEIQNAELERARDEAEAALERYTDLYDFAPVGYFTLARDGGIYSANLAGADLLGVARARLLGRRFGTFVSPASRPAFDAFLGRTLDGAQRETCEVSLLPGGGRERIARIEATASPSGNECRAAVLDVTEQRVAEAEIRRMNAELETAVRERTTELEMAIAEVEAFVQSVSHALSAPLRAISGSSQSLAEECGDLLSPEGRADLRRVRDGAQRMGVLVEDLLRLSRLGRSGLETRTVDLAVPCREILAELAAGSPGRHVETVVPEHIPVRGDPRLLRVMLENLLGNAWKFTAARAEARIEVGTRLEADGQRELSVRDNGPGFDMAHADGLFRPFQQLHTEAVSPGTGVGLTIVDRIVRRHGGTLRAEGAVGAGATFYVRLPTPEKRLA